MKRRWMAWALAAAMVCLGGGSRAAAEGAVCAAVLRLRVVARDDSPAAQAEKLRARDAVIAACPDRCDDPEALLSLIRRAAAPYAPCAAELRLWSPGGCVPPAPTVVITLGPGIGQNWWGVLYQDALLWARAEEEQPDQDTGEEQPPADGAEASPEGGRVTFVWPLLQWLWGLLF